MGNEQGGRRGSKATLGLDRDVLILDGDLGNTGEHIRPRNIQDLCFSCYANSASIESCQIESISLVKMSVMSRN